MLVRNPTGARRHGCVPRKLADKRFVFKTDQRLEPEGPELPARICSQHPKSNHRATQVIEKRKLADSLSSSINQHNKRSKYTNRHQQECKG
jgi:hypothetical protein